MIKPTRILVFQHIAAEHPGIFRKFLQEDGIEWLPIELDEGESIPSLDKFDALWVMGGPMDVWEEKEHPWLVDEKAAIREAVVERKLPYLGFCLGHQLLADALGGKVGIAGTPEIGVLDVKTTEQGLDSPFLQNLPTALRCLQWHSAEVMREPESAKVLASTSACPIQAMSVGAHALSVQFHIEITPATVSEWGGIPAYKTALEKSLGNNALENLNTEANKYIDAMNQHSRLLYENWKRATLPNV
ncbi:MAG: type 1 glutamine amidotransferase [Gammaproteobacteria bacterium]|nr:MAG: type 1 glutamine amidotransferase [Gammaproteobacteria bacterium]